jgi:hypothetical protein
VLQPETEKVLDADVPRPSPRAFQILESDGSSQNPLAHATSVVAAGQHLNDVIRTLSTLNDAESQKVTSISQLQVYKTIWPKILHKIHTAVPQDELTKAMAEGPEKYTQLIAANPDKYARSKRQVIFIDKMQAVYSNDVLTAYDAVVNKSPAGGGMPAMPGMPGAAPGQAPSQPVPGFLITIEGRTPNAGGCTFVNKEFINRLRPPAPPVKKDGAAPTASTGGKPEAGQDLYFDRDRFHLGGCHSMKDTQKAGGGQPWAVGGGGRGGIGGMGMQAAVDPTRDPVTGESMQDDYQFQIMFVAVLGNKPAEQPAAEPAF